MVALAYVYTEARVDGRLWGGGGGGVLRGGVGVRGLAALREFTTAVMEVGKKILQFEITAGALS